MPLIFLRIGRSRSPSTSAAGAIAILGFADVGCQSGAAAFLDSFDTGS